MANIFLYYVKEKCRMSKSGNNLKISSFFSTENNTQMLGGKITRNMRHIFLAGNSLSDVEILIKYFFFDILKIFPSSL